MAAAAENTGIRSYWVPNYGPEYEVDEELKAFDETKAGVKGLLDAGVEQLPSFFVVRPQEEASSHGASHLQLPVIDLKGLNQSDEAERKRIIEQLREASETWGFFQIVNHGVPQQLIDDMIEGIRSFHEQLSPEEKAEYYSRDNKNKIRLTSNNLLFKQKAADWRDTLYLDMAPNVPEPEEIPELIRDVTIKYTATIHELGRTLFKLLSEGLGLEPNLLIDLGCANGQSISGNYYPPCPQPDKTFANLPHTDPDFMTILAQDAVGGLQVFYQNQWIDVAPVPGAFIVNIGDMLQQLITNDKLKSVLHRVLPTHTASRVSVVSLFSTYDRNFDTVFGPIKELISEENPPLYRDLMIRDYIYHFTQKGFSALDRFRL
ncbi:hypothetical protein Tsubulata_003985 [Turnera subulata]|uniref:Fe2OG dioxygenase domain-containing protein n=1 Tax=Turnera subulata TaxID=218843 RepID=A0A9Q0FMB7_9ROSI|nr:hypothetical protein Tsubulata_003985 [Turnera subulata]